MPSVGGHSFSEDQVLELGDKRKVPGIEIAQLIVHDLNVREYVYQEALRQDEARLNGGSGTSSDFVRDSYKKPMRPLDDDQYQKFEDPERARKYDVAVAMSVEFQGNVKQQYTVEDLARFKAELIAGGEKCKDPVEKLTDFLKTKWQEFATPKPEDGGLKSEFNGGDDYKVVTVPNTRLGSGVDAPASEIAPAIIKPI